MQAGGGGDQATEHEDKARRRKRRGAHAAAFLVCVEPSCVKRSLFVWSTQGKRRDLEKVRVRGVVSARAGMSVCTTLAGQAAACWAGRLCQCGAVGGCAIARALFLHQTKQKPGVQNKREAAKQRGVVCVCASVSAFVLQGSERACMLSGEDGDGADFD